MHCSIHVSNFMPIIIFCLSVTSNTGDDIV